MAYPVIKFNTSTGSDSLSSGAGPDDPVNGSGASLNATTTVDLSADNPDLSTIATDGSAVLWVETTSGKQFAQITNVDNSLKTITVAEAYGVTESTKNWAIGGKRNSWNETNSKRLFQGNSSTDFDARSGWTIETETDQTLSRAVVNQSGSKDAPITYRSADPNDIKTINSTAGQGSVFYNSGTSSYIIFENLRFTTSAGSPSEGLLTSMRGNKIIRNCEFDGGYRGISGSSSSDTQYTIRNCVFKNQSDHSFNSSTQAKLINIKGCTFYNVGGNAIDCNDNSIDGFIIISDCIIHSVVDGINITSSADLYFNTSITNCIFSSCSDTAIQIDFANLTNYLDVSNCAFYNNTTDVTSNVNVENQVDLSVDPFVDSGNENLNINNETGGGVILRNNYITLLNNVRKFPFRQWVTTDFGRSGGGTILPSYAKLTIKGS